MENDEIRNYCQWSGCKDSADIVYLGKGVCDMHWKLIDKMKDEKFKKKLGIKYENKNR